MTRESTTNKESLSHRLTSEKFSEASKALANSHGIASVNRHDGCSLFSEFRLQGVRTQYR